MRTFVEIDRPEYAKYLRPSERKRGMAALFGWAALVATAATVLAPIHFRKPAPSETVVMSRKPSPVFQRLAAVVTANRAPLKTGRSVTVSRPLDGRTSYNRLTNDRLDQ